MITGDTLIIDILRSCPQAQGVLKKHGMHCSCCLAANLEKIESGAKTHAVNIDELLKELNVLMAKGRKGD